VYAAEQTIKARSMVVTYECQKHLVAQGSVRSGKKADSPMNSENSENTSLFLRARRLRDW
jgi:hypothetical protein